jgi:hypothetical protein
LAQGTLLSGKLSACTRVYTKASGGDAEFFARNTPRFGARTLVVSIFYAAGSDN